MSGFAPDHGDAAGRLSASFVLAVIDAAMAELPCGPDTAMGGRQ